MNTQQTGGSGERFRRSQAPNPVPSSVRVPQARTVEQLLAAHASEIARAVPRHLNADRLLRIATVAIRQTPELLECTPHSLLAAVIQCAILGLEPGVLGHAYLVPFHNRQSGTKDVVFVSGYRGLIDLAYRSGRVSSVIARTVRETDSFSLELGSDGDRITHRPALRGTPGKPIGYYAVLSLKDAPPRVVYMTLEEVDAWRRRYSKAPDRGPWVDAFDQMAWKTVVRQVLRWAPLTVELARALSHDERPLTLDEVSLAGEAVEATAEAPPAPALDAPPAPAPQSDHPHEDVSRGGIFDALS